MKCAVEATIKNEMCYKTASKNDNVPTSTPRDRVKNGKKKIINRGEKCFVNFKTVLTKEPSYFSS